MTEHPVTLIAGPTASGKSALALALAERRGSFVINADSMQVYAELRILTARPGPEEERRAPHRLYGHVPMAAGYSVARWLEDAEAGLAEARAAGRAPIFVGGSGLYFKALTEGLSPMPRIPAEIRQEVRQRLAREGRAVLHAELSMRDPKIAARLPAGDSQRLLRAFEVLEATGRPLSAWQQAPRQGALVDALKARRVVLWPDRAVLHARINARLDGMIAAGALDEVSAIARLGLESALPGYRAHGLRPLLAHIRGEITLEEAAERTRGETRQYAKRQFTWFRHQTSDWERLAPEDAFAVLSSGE